MMIIVLGMKEAREGQLAKSRVVTGQNYFTKFDLIEIILPLPE
jgi:hypothetical protein